jgi:hypothetical protein
MKKSEYIKKREVKQFIEFFASKICREFEHRYLIRQTGEEWSCKNIKDAALSYRWPWRGGSNLLCCSVAELKNYQSVLLKALKKGGAAKLRASSIDVFRWGGVLNGNKNRVTAHEADLPTKYNETISELWLGGDDSILGKVWNMNSGFSKVYSLLSCGMIMYDSRVGAALGYLVKQCAIAHKWDTIPGELLFPYAPPRNSPTAVNPLNRNPGSFQNVSFPSFSNQPRLQSVFMLRASWIIDAVINEVKCIKESDLKCGEIKIPKHRFIEAGLFMIGYDLPTNLTTAKQSSKKSSINSINTQYQYQTLCKGSKFNAELSDSSSTLRISSKKGKPANIKIDDIIGALLWLIPHWGTVEFFPLDNDAAKVRKGSGKNGLGTALFKVIGKTFNPPDASSLAAILYNLEVLECDQSRRSSNFRIKIMPTRESLVESLKNEFDGKSDES